MRGLTPSEERDLILSVGTHRKERPLSPIEVARLIRKAIAAGETRDECARELQIGSSQIAVFLNLPKVSPEIQHLADWGNRSSSMIAFSSLAQLVGLNDNNDQITAAKAILTHRLSWKEVVQLVQLRNRSGKSITDCAADVLKLRPKVEKRHVFVGAITLPKLKERLGHLQQNGRDELLRRSLQRVLKNGASDFAARLGVERFTIVGARDAAALCGVSPDELEALINQTLLEEASR